MFIELACPLVIEEAIGAVLAAITSLVPRPVAPPSRGSPVVTQPEKAAIEIIRQVVVLNWNV